MESKNCSGSSSEHTENCENVEKLPKANENKSSFSSDASKDEDAAADSEFEDIPENAATDSEFDDIPEGAATADSFDKAEDVSSEEEAESDSDSDSGDDEPNVSPLEQLLRAQGIDEETPLLERFQILYNPPVVISNLLQRMQYRDLLLYFIFFLFVSEVIALDVNKILCFLSVWILHGAVNTCNLYLVAEVNKQSRADKVVIAYIVGGILFVYVTFIGGILMDQQLYLGLVFMCPNVSLQNGWALLWVITMLDFTAKAFTIIVKCMLFALPQQIGPSLQCRGKYYLLIEANSELYQQFLPITPWAYFLIGSSFDGGVIGSALAVVRLAVYSYFKLPHAWEFCKMWKITVVNCFLKQKHYGTRPTAEEMLEAHPICSICLRNFNDATRLSCSHIFCSECIHTMFVMTQAQTCPICRALILPYKPSHWDGTTSSVIQIF